MPANKKKLREEYNEFIEQLSLLNVFQDSVDAHLDRDVFRKVISAEEVEPIDYLIEEDYAWRNHNENSFEVKAIYTIKARNPLDKRQLVFEFETELVALYRSNKKLDNELSKKFIPNLKLNIWPYFREQVHDISKRFNMPSLVIPPFKVGGNNYNQPGKTSEGNQKQTASHK